MQLLYVNVIEENAGWGAEWFVDRGFAQAGHTTHCIDFHKHRQRLYRHFLALPRYDAFLLQRGDYFPLPLLRHTEGPHFFWASELVSRCRDQDRLLQSGLFSYVWFRTRGCIDQAVANGWIARERCGIMLSGFDAQIHRYLPATKKDIEVLFVGALTPRRKRVIEQLQAHVPVSYYSAYGEEMVQLVNRAKIVLNIHAEDHLDTETRVYEVLGCRTLLISEPLTPENPFSGDDLLEAPSTEALIDRIRYYLSHDDEREALAEHGYRSALQHHTYTHRAQEIVQTIQRYLDNPSLRANATHASTLALLPYYLRDECLHGMKAVLRPPWRLAKKVFRAGQAIHP